MDTYLLIPLLIVLLLVLIVVNKRQKKTATVKNVDNKTTVKNKKITAKNKTVNTSKAAAIKPNKKNTNEIVTGNKDNNANSEKTTDEEWDWQATTPEQATVSVETVDHLTEYKVYKQFGYFQKAAESLFSYLKIHSSTLSKGMLTTLVSELANLCLQAKNPDQLNAILETYHDELTKEELEDFLKQGLSLDNNHLGLRVLAEDLLGWGVEQTESEVGIASDASDVSILDVDNSQSYLNEGEINDHSELEKTSLKLQLVTGPDEYYQVNVDEQEVLLSFVPAEKSYHLLRDQLPYEVAIRCLNNAIRQEKKPASLIIDALIFDYKNHNISVFAQHLWKLYYVLDQKGIKVKERMLGWGFNLGQNQLFDQLEKNPNEAQIREIGIKQGLLPMGSSSLKAKRLPLVESNNSGINQAQTPTEKVLRDVESLLTYGQLDQAMDLLESSILTYPQESQLYISLFDIYERAEDWARLQKMLQQIRAKIKTPPEEVVLAMSQLLKRINHDGAQSK